MDFGKNFQGSKLGLFINPFGALLGQFLPDRQFAYLSITLSKFLGSFFPLNNIFKSTLPIPFKLTITQKARKVRNREVLRGLSYGNKTALKTYLRTSPSESKMRQNHPQRASFYCCSSINQLHDQGEAVLICW